MAISFKLLLITLFLSINIYGQKSNVFVKGYLKKDGTYVQPYYRTSPNKNMFDNFSTKGNYNPYTGKAGWIDPYSKVSNSYYYLIPNSYQKFYPKILSYLNSNNQYDYFKIVDKFDYQYKLFFTGLFKLNSYEIEDANKIFDILHRINGADDFITSESVLWFDRTEKFLDAEKEFVDLYSNLDELEIAKNYDSIIKKANGIKNPLNFANKYLVLFVVERKRHNFSGVIKAMDSLIVYLPEKDKLKDSLISGRSAIILDFKAQRDFLTTNANGTYLYQLSDLAKNFDDYVYDKKIPKESLENACFEFLAKESTEKDSMFSRILFDTTDLVVMDKKINTISFSENKSGGDTLLIETFTFF
jgi:hypothetical protein